MSLPKYIAQTVNFVSNDPFVLWPLPRTASGSSSRLRRCSTPGGTGGVEPGWKWLEATGRVIQSDKLPIAILVATLKFDAFILQESTKARCPRRAKPTSEASFLKTSKSFEHLEIFRI